MIWTCTRTCSGSGSGSSRPTRCTRFPGKGDEARAAELKRLRREVATFACERDILKKAAAYFAKDLI